MTGLPGGTGDPQCTARRLDGWQASGGRRQGASTDPRSAFVARSGQGGRVPSGWRGSRPRGAGRTTVQPVRWWIEREAGPTSGTVARGCTHPPRWGSPWRRGRDRAPRRIARAGARSVRQLQRYAQEQGGHLILRLADREPNRPTPQGENHQNWVFIAGSRGKDRDTRIVGMSALRLRVLVPATEQEVAAVVRSHGSRIPGRDTTMRSPASHRPGASGYSQCSVWGGGTSSAGLRSKKPNGLTRNPVYSTGMTGQSSGRTKCVTPKLYQTTTSRSAIGRFAAVHRGSPSPPAC